MHFNYHPKMSCKLVYCVFGVTFLTFAVEPVASAQATERDSAGFLPAPTEAAQSNSTPKTNLMASAPATATNDLASDSTNVLGSYVLDDKHKLTPGDQISFQIVEDRTNAVRLVVAESGDLDVPYIGRVSVAGKTCSQLAAELKIALEKDYYNRATVVIGLDALSRVLGRVYIYGPVRNPGAVDIPANETFTAGKAIMKAGGFGDFANPKKVQIIRKTPTGNETIMVNMVNVLKEGMTEQDVTLQPDDFIIVPQSKINFGW